MKHIESIQPEYAADDMTALLLSDATASAALSRLLHDWTGCAIPQTADTPESEVEELVPLCLSILRRHWTTPLTALGDGTTPMSLADLMRRLIGDRVQGNEAWSIPPANANISTAVAALRERKIGGVPELPDGLSLPRFLCDSSIANTITELIDDNIGWDYADGAKIPFANLRKITLNCKRLGGYAYSYQEWFPSTVEDIEMPYLERFEGAAYIGFPSVNPNYKVWHFPKLKYSRMSFSHSYNSLDDYINDWTEEIIMPEMVEFGGYASNICLCNFTALRKLVLGLPYTYSTLWLKGNTNLIHLEFTKEVTISTNLQHWNPTNALAERLDEFLSNFRLYIADRLSGDNGSGKTLTLSQEVRDAIHSAGIDTIITNKGWTISPVPTQQ